MSGPAAPRLDPVGEARADRIGEHDARARAGAAQEAPDAGDRPAGAGARDERADAAAGLREDLGAGRRARARAGWPGCRTDRPGTSRARPRGGARPAGSCAGSPSGAFGRDLDAARRARRATCACRPTSSRASRRRGGSRARPRRARARRPVLPAVASTIVSPGRSTPRRSASCTIASAIRSLTLPPGLRCSHFASTGTREPGRERPERHERRVADQAEDARLGARRSGAGPRRARSRARGTPRPRGSSAPARSPCGRDARCSRRTRPRRRTPSRASSGSRSGPGLPQHLEALDARDARELRRARRAGSRPPRRRARGVAQAEDDRVADHRGSSWMATGTATSSLELARPAPEPPGHQKLGLATMSTTIRMSSAVSKRKIRKRRLHASARTSRRIGPELWAASSMRPSSGPTKPTPTQRRDEPADEREVDPEDAPPVVVALLHQRGAEGERRGTAPACRRACRSTCPSCRARPASARRRAARRRSRASSA